MKKFIADYEIVSHTSLKNAEEKLKYKEPSGRYEIHLSNLKIDPGIEEPLLSAQVIFEDENLQNARDKSDKYLGEFLGMLSLVMSLSFRIHKITQIIDWTPGVDMRDCRKYLTQSDPHIPYPILDDVALQSVSLLAKNDMPEPLARCIRWYARGVRALYSDDQFQSFWFALELLAQIKKKVDPVSDKCPRCKGDLYCKNCDEVPHHRPFPKQAILSLMKEKIKGNSDKAYEIANDFRNAIMHADSIKAVEEKHKVTLQQAVDIVGKTVYAVLISSFKGEPGTPLPLLTSNTYAHVELAAVAHMQLGNGKENKDDPKIENFRGTQFFIEVSDDPSKLGRKVQRNNE